MRRVLTVNVPGSTAFGLLVVTGEGPSAAGAHTRLAIRIADVVRQAGLRAVALYSSKFRNSNSRYIAFTDALERPWRIRVADHHRPARSAIPHLDLISVDGVAGLGDAREFLRLVIAGDPPWFDSVATAETIPEPLRKRINRCR